MTGVNFAFFGTDEFSVQVLDGLKKRGLTPSLLVTVPDSPKGRKLIITPPPAKVWAEENGIKVIQPASLKNLNFSEVASGYARNDFEKFDLFIVASYGKIIPQEILDIPTHGTLNVHPSLLPKYRGPSPLETAILNGDQETGVSIMLVDAKMDHGPLIAVEKFELNNSYNFEQLRNKMADLGAELLAQVIPDYLAGKITPQEQEHSAATYTRKFVKEDGYLDPEAPAENRFRKFLALNPWPGTYIDYPGPKGKIRIIIKQAHLAPAERDEKEDKLVYDRVVPEGRREMDWKSFLNGLRTAE